MTTGTDWSLLDDWRRTADALYETYVRDTPHVIPALDAVVAQSREALEEELEVDLRDANSLYHLICGANFAVASISTQAEEQCGGICLPFFYAHVTPGTERLMLVFRELVKDCPGVPPIGA